MKRGLLLAASLTLSGAVVAYAAAPGAEDIARINGEIKEILKPYQNPQTSAVITLQELFLGTGNDCLARVSGSFQKKGAKNSIVVNIKNFTHDQKNPNAPVTKLEGGAAIDLTKVLEQKDINDVLDQFDAILKDAITTYLKDYEAGLTVKAAITDRKKDAAGNYLSAAGSVEANLDLRKLPSVDPASVPVLSLKGSVSCVVKTGCELNLVVSGNPKFKYFAGLKQNLRTIIDKSLSRDPETVKIINDILKTIDEQASAIVN